jgi:hypothetical protein
MGTKIQDAFDKEETANACRGEHVTFDTATTATFLRTFLILFSIEPFLLTAPRDHAKFSTDVIWLSTGTDADICAFGNENSGSLNEGFEQVGVAAKLRTRIRMSLVRIPRGIPTILAKSFRNFTQYLQANCGILSRLRHDSFLSNLFQFVSHPNIRRLNMDSKSFVK